MVPSDSNMPESFNGFCSLRPGADLRGYDEGYASSHQPFSKMFLMYNLQFFHNFELTRNRKCNVQTRCIMLGDALRIGVNKFEQNFA